MHSRSGSLSAARTNRAVNWDYREKSFGDVPGVKVGDTWNSRSECLKARVHRASWGGIHGWESFGADSIVLSGGYSDDIDEGETIVYTGSGSRENWRENEQTCDQSFENRFNKALVTSCNRKKPVRVIRGSSLDSKYAPESKYAFTTSLITSFDNSITAVLVNRFIATTGFIRLLRFDFVCYSLR
ncbi:hypothetical protein AcW1_008728 [Taiwanofungus camphoratus]|nr:hypothetical protein AcV5_006746 [Antrodia cinnamomea]KAI0949010.1 hypothetical protein AcW1_008728 [Antrodia cinnamomea]